MADARIEVVRTTEAELAAKLVGSVSTWKREAYHYPPCDPGTCVGCDQQEGRDAVSTMRASA